jgi:hypothetical protein
MVPEIEVETTMSDVHRKTYQLQHTDGRPDELFELETKSDCQHQLVNLGDVPTLPFGETTMTKGGCVLCSNTYIEQKDRKDNHIAFFKKIAG